MAHYAVLDQDNIVINVFVGKDETDPCPDANWEVYYSKVLKKKVVQTSYNSYRGKHPDGPGKVKRHTFAGKGFKYDVGKDAFIEPKPYPSWTLKNKDWEAPVKYPNDRKNYEWSERNQAWYEVKN